MHRVIIGLLTLCLIPLLSLAQSQTQREDGPTHLLPTAPKPAVDPSTGVEANWNRTFKKSAPTQSAPIKLSGIPGPASTLIAYSWSARPDKIFHNGNLAFDPSNYVYLPETNAILDGFYEANLTLWDGQNSYDIYDCVNDDTKHCAALDAKVSPDGTKIAFWVVYAEGLAPTSLDGFIIHKLWHSYESRIMIYDLQSRELSSWPYRQNVFDAHPEWLDDDTIVFVSTRSREWPLSIRNVGHSYRHEALQRWEGKADGSSAFRTGSQDDMCLHPFVKSNGDLVTSCWQLGEFKYIRGNSYLIHHGSGLTSAYWTMMSDRWGQDELAKAGAHTSGKFDTWGHLRLGLLSQHFHNENPVTGSNYFVDYYASGGHFGFGNIVSFKDAPFGAEGEGAKLEPYKLRHMTPWAQARDNEPYRDSNGRLMGKAGYPVGLPDGGIMLSWARGNCYNRHPTSKFAEGTGWLGGEPGCDIGIYRTRDDAIIDHPDELTKLLDSPQRYEFAAEWIEGHEIRLSSHTPRGACEHRIVNLRSHQLQSDYDFGSRHNCTDQDKRCVSGLGADAIDKYAIWKVNMNKSREAHADNYVGHDIELLGFARTETDGSVRVKVPCDMPILAGGVTANNELVVKDQLKHSLSRGGDDTCYGCHDGHEHGTYNESAIDMFERTIAASKPAQSLKLHGAISHPEFNRDVKPVLQRRCASCHDTVFLSADALSRDYKQDLVRDYTKIAGGRHETDRIYWLQQNFSKYTSKFAVDSYLYWVCKQQRTDGRSNADYSNDIDWFGHPQHGATDLECAAIARWIDDGLLVE
jgi:hypothetical protein